MTGVSHHTQHFPIEIWAFHVGWPQTTILPVSASQATGIPGVSHRHLAANVLIFQNYLIILNPWNYQKRFLFFKENGLLR
jgi:hypothetical protein